MKIPRTVLAFAAGLAFLPAAVAPAAVKTWNSGSGNWSVPGNWTLAGVPASGDAVNIVNTDGAARTVALDVSTPSLGLTALDLTGPGSAANTLSITSNNSITAAALSVGGYNGTAFTNGRGAVNQSAGTTTISPGVDLIMAWGSGSTGTYTLSGGAIVANQGVWVGYAGTGTFNHSAGTHTINTSAASGFWLGANAGATGVYNLSGAGTLTANANEYVGYLGAGIFNQTGGTNTVTSAAGLTLGWGSGSNGAYTISGGTLTANSKIEVGRLGTGTLTIQNNGSVFTDNLTINSQSNVYLNGGTLRFNTVSGSGGLSPANFHFNSGTIQLAPYVGELDVATDPRITALFGSTPTIPTGKGLTIDSSYAMIGSPIGASPTLHVNGGRLTIRAIMAIGHSQSGVETLKITDGGVVSCDHVALNGAGQGDAVTVSGSGSTWDVGKLDVGHVALAMFPTLNIQDQALVSIGSQLFIGEKSTVNLRGGTLRLNSTATNSYIRRPSGTLNFHAGTLELVGDRSIGTDAAIADILGAAPAITAGKELAVVGTATLLTTVTLDGGTLSVGQLAGASLLNLQRGTLNVADQAITIGPSGPLGDTLDLGHDMTINVTLGITNQGLVTGDGRIGGPFHNAANGELRAEPGRSITLSGANNTNADRVYLQGGTLDFLQNLTNAPTGQILGRGTLMTGGAGLNNQGHIGLSSGITDVFGDVNNNTGVAARGITVSGNADVTFWDDVTNAAGSLFRVSAGSSATFFGTFGGAGISGPGNVYFEADVTPGASPAVAQFGGNVSLGTASRLNMELGGMTPGAQYDQLLVSGALSLGGSLEVSLINGFSPIAGQSFNILDWGSLVGTFSALNLPSLTGLAWDTSQLYTTGVLSVAAAGLPGDYNQNGTADAADYVLWRKNLGSSISLPNDNTPGVGPDDYDRWRSHFGQTLGGGTAESLHSVPEPIHSANLLMFVVAGSTFRLTRFRNPLAHR